MRWKKQSTKESDIELLIFYEGEIADIESIFTRSAWNLTAREKSSINAYNVYKILSPSSSLSLLAKTNAPCSVVSLRQLSYFLFMFDVVY